MSEPNMSDFGRWVEQTSEDERSMDVAECILQRLSYACESLRYRNHRLTSNLALMGRMVRNQDMQSQQLENEIFQRETATTTLQERVNHLENVSYDGVRLVEIAGYSQKKYAAVCGSPCIYSHDFFTDRKGYRMCVQVYLHGEGDGKGTHLSVYIILKKGPNDNFLRWPFQGRVTFNLLNQAGKDHFTNVFRSDPASPAFKKPVEEMNIASGCSRFVSHKVIEDPEKGFLWNDTVAVKVSVDVPDL